MKLNHNDIKAVVPEFGVLFSVGSTSNKSVLNSNDPPNFSWPYKSTKF